LYEIDIITLNEIDENNITLYVKISSTFEAVQVVNPARLNITILNDVPSSIVENKIMIEAQAFYDII